MNKQTSSSSLSPSKSKHKVNTNTSYSSRRITRAFLKRKFEYNCHKSNQEPESKVSRPDFDTVVQDQNNEIVSGTSSPNNNEYFTRSNEHESDVEDSSANSGKLSNRMLSSQSNSTCHSISESGYLTNENNSTDRDMSEKCLVYLPSWQDNSYVVSKSKYTKSKSDGIQYHGRICRLLSKQKLGYINHEDCSESSYERIKFHFKDLINLCKEPVKIECGSFVAFTLSRNRSRNYSTARLVFVNKKSMLNDNEKSKSSPTQKWFKGVIITVPKSNNGYFVKSLDRLPFEQSKDIFLPKSNLLQIGFPLIVGDEVEVKLGEKNPEKPFAKKCRVVRYCQRSLKSILEYFDTVIYDYDFKLSSELLTNTSIWLYLSSIIFKYRNNSIHFCLRLMHFVTLLYRRSQFSVSLYRPVIKQIMMSTAFDGGSNFFQYITETSLQEVFSVNSDIDESSLTVFDVIAEYFQIALLVDKSYSNRVMPFVFRIGESESSNRIQVWLMDMMRLNSHDGSIQFCKRNWREIDFIPNVSEIKKGLLEEDSSLLTVKIGENYSSCEEYMETYYRLLRAECYSSIQTGIHKYCVGSLDHRDMNVYEKVQLCGYDMNTTGLVIALSFTPVRQIKRWETAKNFMFGNLLCLSPSGKFTNDRIWATVADRNLALLKKEPSVILVQLCTDDQNLVSEILIQLSQTGESAIMVESPSYFNSMKPVLQTLQRFDMQTFPLRHEIVDGISEGLPNYLSESTLFDPRSLDPNKFTMKHLIPFPEIDRISKADFLSMLMKNTSTFDRSQTEAIHHALTNRLSIIQGPPGCGKTFIGVQLVKIILSCKPRIKGPILILTYKNHALDEFLKHTLQFLYTSEIVRIGNRSKEECLEMCNIKNVKHSPSFFNKDELFSLKDEISKIRWIYF